MKSAATMKEIVLYGELAQRFGKRHRYAVKTAAEAIRALRANLKGFEQFMCSAHQNGMGFKLFVGGTKINDYPEIHNPAGRAPVIRLVPVIAGSKDGILGILLGVALVGAAVLAAPFTAGTSLAFIPSALGSLGIAMAIGGVSQLLSSPPEAKAFKEQKGSHFFSGPINTSIQGKAVPVGYGRLIIGSAVISAGIETYETPA